MVELRQLRIGDLAEIAQTAKGTKMRQASAKALRLRSYRYYASGYDRFTAGPPGRAKPPAVGPARERDPDRASDEDAAQDRAARHEGARHGNRSGLIRGGSRNRSN